MGIRINDLDELLNQFSITLRNHSRRVAVCSAIIAEYAGSFMNIYDLPSGTSLPVIAHLGGTCHDIGKLMLPALDANNDDYFKHPAMGADLLEKHKAELFGNEPYSQMVLDIVRYHHEQTDGGGFPEGLEARDIPLLAGICAAANELDHLMYSESGLANNGAGVYEKLKGQAGKRFCECVWVCIDRAWLRLIERYMTWNSFANFYDAE